MKEELDLYNATLDEIVFEDRNKSYGGYYLRVWYRKNVTKAVIITCSAFFLLAWGIDYYVIVSSKPTEVYVPMKVEMEVPDEPLKEEEMKKLPPPPPKVEQPKLETVKFAVAEIKPDKSVKKEEQMQEMNDLLKTNISTENQEGEKKKGDIPPDLGSDDGEKGGTGENTEQVFTYVGEWPKFKGGGDEEVLKYVQNRIIYPEDAKQKNITGTVAVEYTITSTGEVTNVHVVTGKGLCPSIDAEAVRVIKSMPKWTPGKNNGVPVSVKKIARIKFSLNSN